MLGLIPGWGAKIPQATLTSHAAHPHPLPPPLVQRLLSSCGVQASHCGGFSCWGALGLAGSVVVAHGLSHSVSCLFSQAWDRTRILLQHVLQGRLLVTRPLWKPENEVLSRVQVCSVTQLCLTLCDPMDYSPPGSSVHGNFCARILEWVAISYSMEQSQPRDQTWVSCASCISRQILYHCTTWEATLNTVGSSLIFATFRSY